MDGATAFIDMGCEGPMVGIVCGAPVPEILERTGWTIVCALQTHDTAVRGLPS